MVIYYIGSKTPEDELKEEKMEVFQSFTQQSNYFKKAKITILYSLLSLANSKVSSKVGQAFISASGKISKLAKCEYAPFSP